MFRSNHCFWTTRLTLCSLSSETNPGGGWRPPLLIKESIVCLEINPAVSNLNLQMGFFPSSSSLQSSKWGISQNPPPFVCVWYVCMYLHIVNTSSVGADPSALFLWAPSLSFVFSFLLPLLLLLLLLLWFSLVFLVICFFVCFLFSSCWAWPKFKEKVLGSNPVACRWNLCQPSANELDLGVPKASWVVCESSPKKLK